MFETTFNPGPSKISAETYADLQYLCQHKFGEISHRTEIFSEISEKAVVEMKKYFSIPAGYEMVWGTSATNMMETVIQAVVQKESFHFVCGNFSAQWQKIADSFEKKTTADVVPWGQKNNYQTAKIPASAELIAITQSESSTGVLAHNDDIAFVKKNNPQALVAVDATSIMGAVPINISDADVWVFSVQKCFGLPAGLGVMIYNKKFVEKSLVTKNITGIINFQSMRAKMEKNFQTVQTPNFLGIYLLAHQLERWNKNGGLTAAYEKTLEKKKFLEIAVAKTDGLDFFVENELDRSPTVNCLKISEDRRKIMFENAEKNKIVIGGGYGKIKSETIRVANFPNILMAEYQRLVEMF